MKRILPLWLGWCLLTGDPVAAFATEWGGVTPGVSTPENVRERYGSPSRESTQTQEGYKTSRWIYEGARAPVGMTRMTVDFGLLTPQGYHPNLVRAVLLEPKPGIFTRAIVLEGWGTPDRAGVQEGQDLFFYKSGLIVSFPEGGGDATSLLFTIPQPDPGSPAGR